MANDRTARQDERITSFTDEAARVGARLPALLVEADRVAHTVAQGLHGRRRAGPGEAFWQFRRYRPGDSAALIDWRKSARSDRYLVRETEWEAANTVWLWTDLSDSMNFRSRLAQTTKRDRAILLTLALAGLLVRGGERVGALGSGMPPSAGKRAVTRIAEHVIHRADAGGGRSSLPAAERLGRFSHVVLFGDFLSPIEDITAALAALAARDVRGHVVQILDPIEETFPFRGRTEFEAVSGRLRLIAGRAELLRGDYRERLEAHRSQLQRLARRLGWTFTFHHTDRTPQAILLALHGFLAGHTLVAADAVEHTEVTPAAALD